MTTDLQRMHQDEWLADLLTTEDEQGRGVGSLTGPPYCVLGRAFRLTATEAETYGAGLVYLQGWLGISWNLIDALWQMNDPDPCTRERASFGDIALFFKEQRDRCDGDLSDWTPA